MKTNDIKKFLRYGQIFLIIYTMTSDESNRRIYFKILLIFIRVLIFLLIPLPRFPFHSPGVFLYPPDLFNIPDPLISRFPNTVSFPLKFNIAGIYITDIFQIGKEN